MLGKNNKENVKMAKSSCSNCCLCPVSKRRKHTVTEDDTERVQINSVDEVPQTDDETPYVGDLPIDIGLGTCITIRGFVKPNCSRFSINLCSSREANSDIAVHINPRVSLRYIVRTHRINGVWGPEETSSNSKYNLPRNTKFDMDIVLTLNEFLVTINGKHMCAFVYRLPLTKVKAIRVEGRVEVYNVDYKKVDIYPSPMQDVSVTVPTGEEHKDIPDEMMAMPVIASLPKGFHQGWQLEIYGRLKILPSAFYINLQNGVHLWPHPAIYLHLNARFNTAHGRHLTVKNSWLDGSWGQEERSPGFEFTPGSPYSIAIRKEFNRFSIWVDGKLSSEFRFRGDVEKLDTVYIQGDVETNYIYMKEKVDDKYFTKRDVLRPISL